MDRLSRRYLLQYSLGTAGAGLAVHPFDLLGTPLSSGAAPGLLPAAGALLAGSLPGLETGTDTYRILPAKGEGARFGMVEDLFQHIQNRSDVKREILYWLTDGRSSLLGASSRFQFLEHLIRPLYEKAGIPMAFGFGLGMQESLFRNYSISSANAKGIWQMQWAGRKYGLRGGDYFDVLKSTQKQLEYLRDLVRNFAWNLELVLVDYNYGPGKKFVRYRSDRNAFRRVYHRLPRETRRFVPRVLAAAAIGLKPERYGVHIPRLDSRTVEVKLDRSLHHLELGLLLGTDHWNLGNLNPGENIRIWLKEGQSAVVPQVYEEVFWERLQRPPLTRGLPRVRFQCVSGSWRADRLRGTERRQPRPDLQPIQAVRRPGPSAPDALQRVDQLRDQTRSASGHPLYRVRKAPRYKIQTNLKSQLPDP